jgi:hypothetical protein
MADISRRSLRNAQVAAFFSREMELVGGMVLGIVVPASGVVTLPEPLKFKGVFGECGRNGFLLRPVGSTDPDETYVVGATNLKLGRELAGKNAPLAPGSTGNVSAMEFRRATASAEIKAIVARTASSIAEIQAEVSAPEGWVKVEEGTDAETTELLEDFKALEAEMGLSNAE